MVCHEKGGQRGGHRAVTARATNVLRHNPRRYQVATTQNSPASEIMQNSNNGQHDRSACPHYNNFESFRHNTNGLIVKDYFFVARKMIVRLLLGCLGTAVLSTHTSPLHASLRSLRCCCHRRRRDYHHQIINIIK